MKNLTKELVILSIVCIPILYLAKVYNSLPAMVPTHYSINGIANDYSKKSTLMLILLGLGFGIYLLMRYLPTLDPKNKFAEMGNKYFSIRLYTTLFISALSIYIVSNSNNTVLQNANYIYFIIGAFFIMLGNYFQTIRPNYFIGIRTAWTLENNEIWKQTHKVGGIIWLIGGLLIILNSIFLEQTINAKLFLVITLIIVLIPIVYSYYLFKKSKSIIS